MDLLYSRYSSPMDLVDRYIKQERFGTFVNGFMKARYEQERKEAERDNEWMMWVAFVHSYSDKTYGEWKKDFMGTKNNSATKDSELNEDGIKALWDKLFTEKDEEE